MKDKFSYTTRFTLDKNYYQECFDQSMPLDLSWRAFSKAIFYCLFGGVLVLFTDINAYAAWFIFALGVVEALSVYYQKPWWVARQMISKAAKGEVELTIDELGIKSQSYYIDERILWSDISSIQSTDLGWIIKHSKGKNYISSTMLSDPANAFVADKSMATSEGKTHLNKAQKNV